MFLFGYLFAFGIPFAYAYLAKPPTQDDMRVSEGKAHFQYRMKRGYMLRVNGDDYTCGGLYLNADPSCFHLAAGIEKRKFLEGKTVIVLWFHQPAYLFASVRRVADILHDGASQLPTEYLRKTLQSEKESAKGDALFSLFLMLLGLLFCEWVERMRKRNERRFGQANRVSSH